VVALPSYTASAWETLRSLFFYPLPELAERID
jgi:hypothetical protein